MSMIPHSLLGLGAAAIGLGGLTACQTEPPAPALSAPPTVETAQPSPPTATLALSEDEARIVSQMVWVETADPVADAQAALARGAPYELIAFAMRKISYPGLTEAEYEAIRDQVTHRVPQGAGDVLYGDRHTELHRRMHSYAQTFNRTIYEAVSESR